MKIHATLALAALTLMLTACGKEPPPLMSLPPVTEMPKAAPNQPVSPADEARQKEVGQRLAKEAFIVKGDFDHAEIVGKSGKQCSVTCDGQATLESCKAALAADGCLEARDDWRTKNPDKRSYADQGGGRFQMRR